MTTDNVLTGRVKWFNNKSGYGFVTVILSNGDDSLVGKDVFAHHSSIKVGKEQFRYLVQGEYIEFTLSTVNDEKSEHKFQTENLHGIGGGMLMCETRYEAKINERSTDEEGNKAPKWNVSRGKKTKSATSEENN
jgi:cold shock CspA family protein